MGDVIRDGFMGLGKRFKPNKVEKEMSFYFTLGDGPDDKWTVFVGPSQCEIKEGKAVERADCVLKTSRDLFLSILTKGYTPGMGDFMSGKIKSNDPMLLKSFKDVFGL